MKMFNVYKSSMTVCVKKLVNTNFDVTKTTVRQTYPKLLVLGGRPL